MFSHLKAISPVDGRYHNKANELHTAFSEYGLIYYRLLVEIRYFEALSDFDSVKECPSLSAEAKQYLQSLLDNFNEQEAQKVKDIESETNHDVKACEYYLREKFQASEELKDRTSFIHFALTSEDVNNLAYAKMMQASVNEHLSPLCFNITDHIDDMAKSYALLPMLSRTHGQPASPTTLGKELANVSHRLKRQLARLKMANFLGKCNGAVGNYNAHLSAYKELDWPAFSAQFVESLQLEFNPMTTQIEPHDWMAEIFHDLSRFNTILIDFARDTWSYISLGYFKQKLKANEVGSSTMPHKVNPIDFENAEGNLGLANALFHFFADKLPISRFQRDLTDSTVLRNVGVAFAHSMIAYKSLLKGLAKLEVSEETLLEDVNKEWGLLAEPIQTVMRRYHIDDAYEQLKSFSRGEKINQQMVSAFIDNLTIPDEAKAALKSLTPSDYVGLAKTLVNQ